MDLYEALKAGTSAEELLTAFHKDLDAAQARIDEEEEAAYDQEHLEDCRSELANAILDYAEALYGDLDEDFSIESVEDILKGFEKEVEGLVSVSKKLDEVLSDAKREGKKPVGVKVKTYIADDDDIIRKFLNSLK